MTTILLVRHGEVEGNTGGKLTFVGWGDLELTVKGEKQSQQVAEYLANEKIAAVYSSDLQRAKMTAESIAHKHHLAVKIDRDLREVNYGAWENLGEAELLKDWPHEYSSRQNDAWNIAPPGGESYAQMWSRFFPKWQNLVQAHDGETAVLIGHNGLIRMLICHLMGAPFENFKRVHVSNCGVSRIEIGDEKVLIKQLNDTHFLQAS